LGTCKTNLVVAKDIVCTLASNQIVSNGRSFAKTLRVDKRNIKRAMGRRVQLDTIKNDFWINSKWARCSNVMSQVMKDGVIEWWTKETTISPNKKRCCEEAYCYQVFQGASQTLFPSFRSKMDIYHFIQICILLCKSNLTICCFP
jgi:hypothetical protein